MKQLVKPQLIREVFLITPLEAVTFKMKLNSVFNQIKT